MQMGAKEQLQKKKAALGGQLGEPVGAFQHRHRG